MITIIMLLVRIIFKCQWWTTGSHLTLYDQFYCTTHPFQAFVVPSQLVYLGLSSILVFCSRDHVPWAAMYPKSISPITLPYRLLVSLHIPTQIVSFRTSTLSLAHIHGFRFWHSMVVSMVLLLGTSVLPTPTNMPLARHIRISGR